MKVREITREEASALLLLSNKPDLLLLSNKPDRPITGSLAIDLSICSLLSPIQEASKEIYLLEWEGGKVPRTNLSNYEIFRIQHGIVYGSGGIIIGTYERLMEFGGQNKKLQKMIVFLS